MGSQGEFSPVFFSLTVEQLKLLLTARLARAVEQYTFYNSSVGVKVCSSILNNSSSLQPITKSRVIWFWGRS